MKSLFKKTGLIEEKFELKKLRLLIPKYGIEQFIAGENFERSGSLTSSHLDSYRESLISEIERIESLLAKHNINVD